MEGPAGDSGVAGDEQARRIEKDTTSVERNRKRRQRVFIIVSIYETTAFPSTGERMALSFRRVLGPPGRLRKYPQRMHDGRHGGLKKAGGIPSGTAMSFPNIQLPWT